MVFAVHSVQDYHPVKCRKDQLFFSTTILTRVSVHHFKKIQEDNPVKCQNSKF
jgi:hypothetical protein